MNATLRTALAALALLAIFSNGCSHRDQNSLSSSLLGVQLSPGAARDTVPGPPPNPPPKPTIPPVVFLWSDSVQAGSAGDTHWQLGNGGHGAFTMDWTLTSDAGWPGFPISGSMKVPALATRPLDVTVPVPSSALSGTYGLLMTVHTAAGDTSNAIAMATGAIRVYGNDGPPPPPPPPFPAIEFIGPDSLRIGAHNFIEWQLGNQSDHPFTMPWTAEGPPSWGFPFSGSIALAALERQVVMVEFDVPDSAAAGSRWVQMTVTKPDGTPESVSAQVQLFPFP